MLRAASTLACSTLIVPLVYRLSAKRSQASAITLSYDGNTKRITQASMLLLAILISLYEAIALSIIEVVREVEHNRFAAGMSLGSVSGQVPTTAAVLIYNTLSDWFPGKRLHVIVEPEAKA